MTKPPPNYVGEDSIKSYKSSKDYPQKAKGMSFFAFLLSISIYISIFYIFDLSPSTLFNTSKFWFFISNTLILIIAAHSGAFSSSKPQQDVYEEYCYMMKNASSIVSQPPEVVKEVDDLQEKKVIYIETGFEKPSHQEDLQDKIHATTYPRPSKSEKTKRGVVDEEKKNILRRSETEKHEQPSVEENEFSTMSDEDLNRRFEEFIQRFNTQIRLQGTRNFRPNLK